MLIVGIALSVIVATMILSPTDVLGFKIHGPTPIPGDLFPHPGKHPVQSSKNTYGQASNSLG